ncbi:MAG: Lrp/AsnC ligand binding domain-containing protein [Dehalococcoidia bacterium]|nr:MAG: Lrp/AsnC ligand binding domain-containing protein [Dehalococcoidia bacterium]
MKRRAYILIDTEQGQSSSVVVALSEKPGVVAADVIWGPHDVVAIVEADDIDKLMHLVQSDISLIDGIAHMDTCLIVTGH